MRVLSRMASNCDYSVHGSFRAGPVRNDLLGGKVVLVQIRAEERACLRRCGKRWCKWASRSRAGVTTLRSPMRSDNWAARMGGVLSRRSASTVAPFPTAPRYAGTAESGFCDSLRLADAAVGRTVGVAQSVDARCGPGVGVQSLASPF